MCSFLRRGADLWCDNGYMEDRVVQTLSCIPPSMAEFENRNNVLELLRFL
jgi:hypothetical protein